MSLFEGAALVLIAVVLFAVLGLYFWRGPGSASLDL